MNSWWVPLIAAIFLSNPGLEAQAREMVETKTFPSQPGDTLVVQNDYGSVQVRAWNNDFVEARIRKIAADGRLENVEVVSQKAGTKIYLHAYFYAYSSESVYLQVQVPKYLSVFISGANPAVEIYGLEGHVRANTLTGLITAEDLTASVSLLSDSGDILYRSRVQPVADARLESIRGNVQCELADGMNLRGWTRAGGTLSWNQEIQLSQGFLEKQVGVGGPLLYAGSSDGNVTVSLGATSRAWSPPPSAPPPEPSPSQIPQGTPDERPNLETASSVPQETQSGGNGSKPPYVRTSSGTIDSGYSLKVNVDWIYLNVSVRDRHNNRSIPNLRKDDFLISEDGAPQTVEKFESTEAPFNLLLLLDVSGSTREFIDLIKEASIEFTREIKPNDKIAVAVFNSSVRLVQEFTNDRYEVQQAIDRVRSGGGTAFYDALDTSIREYMQGLEGRKAIVVFSDGVDNQLTGDYGNGSRTTFEELYRQIQEIDTIIYTIFLDTEGSQPGAGGSRRGGTVADILGDIIRGRTPPYGSPGPGRRPRGGGLGDRQAYEEARRQMEMIADQTGGRMYSPRDIQDLSHVYSEIADDLRIQYTLAYSSTNPDRNGRWREIRVKIRNRPEAAARTRRGYYSGKEKKG